MCFSVKLSGQSRVVDLTSLLMTAPLALGDVDIEIIDKLISIPYVDMTFKLMERFEVSVEHSDGWDHFLVRGMTSGGVNPTNAGGVKPTIDNDFATGEGGNSGFDDDITVSYVDLGGSPDVGEQSNGGGDGSQAGENSPGVGDGSQADSGVKSTTPTAKKGKKSRLFEDIPKPPSFKEALKAFPDIEPELYLRSLDLMGENDKLMEIFLGQDEEMKTPWLFRKLHQAGL
ncbi:hypothetical protein IFM89_037753 [Coptis chinensis]|uniref:Enolpyruvate transferase domain-containing protein n=1 Tax=Coptis chinensis TaxID=261450 RepID=A0A835IV12_9MAGN|nr:hypothetical protein IFM89_037753 [Coptis chinensis]